MIDRDSDWCCEDDGVGEVEAKVTVSGRRKKERILAERWIMRNICGPDRADLLEGGKDFD